MKALVLEEYNNLVYRDVPEPEVGPDDVLIKVAACGICGSDVHGMDGSTGRRQVPIIMGHEASGIISETGANVTKWKKGQRVTFDSTIYCGKCSYCLGGQVNLCDNRMVLGVSCDDYRRDGVFAEYVVVPEHIVYALPDEVTFVQAALVEALSIALHATTRAQVYPDDTVVVIGAGMIGMLIIQALRAGGCKQIIAVDTDDKRVEMAGQLGADVGINPKSTDVKARILELTNGRGADAAFEVVGLGITVKIAVDVLQKGGHLTLVGNLTPYIDLALQTVVTRQINLYGSCASSGEYPQSLKMIADGSIDTDTLITAQVPLAEGATWFERLYKGEPGLMKVVLIP